MKKIVWHWTAGTNSTCMTDFHHYHYLIKGDGEIVNGVYKPEANINCKDDMYAAHCGGGNTNAIGLALCGMAGYKSPQHVGSYPLKQIQFERGFKLTAELCKKYGLHINPATVFTHYEFGKLHPNSSSAGKIDITFIPYLPKLSPNEIGDFIRNKCQWYYDKL